MSAVHPHHAHIRTLYEQFIAGWNRRSGATVAAGFADDGDIIAFDGTTHSGRLSIAADLRRVFAEHETASYVAVIRDVRPIADGTAVLHAVAGMIPPGADDIDPRLNFVHTLVAVDEGGRWRIAVLQATPARYFGQPEVSEALTAELRAAR